MVIARPYHLTDGSLDGWTDEWKSLKQYAPSTFFQIWGNLNVNKTESIVF